MTLKDLRTRLGERFADAWVLLSDTDRFLSRARLMPRYERRVREWRRRLQESRGDPEVVREIRSEIVAMRKSLREQGWELRLGSVDIAVKGFRSDDSTARGFRRMVLFLAADGSIYHTEGDTNHIVLDGELRLSLRAMKIAGPMAPHYLWYRVSGGLIELAGADSEPQASFERLKESVEARKSDLVRALRNLR
jgi:hypothetical protein